MFVFIHDSLNLIKRKTLFKIPLSIKFKISKINIENNVTEMSIGMVVISILPSISEW